MKSNSAEWNKTWAWWSHEVWLEIYGYDMLYEAALIKQEAK